MLKVGVSECVGSSLCSDPGPELQMGMKEREREKGDDRGSKL